MAISHEDIISALDGLVATCRDGEQGFRAAAEAAQNAELRGLFLTYAQQRGDFRAELEDEIRRLGGTPSTRGRHRRRAPSRLDERPIRRRRRQRRQCGRRGGAW